jgi:hypothetical protein
MYCGFFHFFGRWPSFNMQILVTAWVIFKVMVSLVKTQTPLWVISYQQPFDISGVLNLDVSYAIASSQNNADTNPGLHVAVSVKSRFSELIPISWYLMSVSSVRLEFSELQKGGERNDFHGRVICITGTFCKS